MSVLRTYEEWKTQGYQVQRGMKCKGKDSSGKGLFSKDQCKIRNYGYDGGDYCQEKHDQWHSEYGYTRDWV